MTQISDTLAPVDELTVDVLTDDVSDYYVSKTLFAVSEFANVVRAGAKTISGEALLLQSRLWPAAGVADRCDTTYLVVRHRTRRSHFHTELLQSRDPHGR